MSDKEKMYDQLCERAIEMAVDAMVEFYHANNELQREPRENRTDYLERRVAHLAATSEAKRLMACDLFGVSEDYIYDRLNERARAAL